jgi:uncharacterized protein YbjT (DUF2867 family)
MVLVTGAAGTTGSEVTRLLAAKGVRVRALVRDPEKLKRFTGASVEPVVANLEDPATLDPALKGIDKVFLVSSPDPRVSLLHGNVIDASKRAGVKQVVRLSALGAATNSPARILKWHGEVDERLSRSGLSFSILRPHSFMQNFLGMRRSIQEEGAIYAPAREGKIVPIDARDVALVAVAVLTSEGHSGRIYDLTGPELLSYADMAKKLGDAMGRTVTYTDVPPDAAREAMIGAGWPEFLADGLLELMALYGTGGQEDITQTVEKLTGTPPRTFDAFAKDFARVLEGKATAKS